MERKKYLLIAIFIGLIGTVSGQTDPTIYKAYIRGHMAKWLKHMELYHASSNAQKLELINYQYGYIAYCIKKKNKDEAEKHLQKAEKLLADLAKQQYKMSMVNAYKSAFVGFKIGLSPYKAPFIGKRSLAYAKKSIALEHSNYFGYVQLGNIAFYTPSMLGGSKTDAIKHYLKALKLIEKNPTLLKNNWNYLNLLATIINAYYETGKYDLAKKFCIKTLAIEPQFYWVKDQLYPQTLKKIRR